MDRQLSPIYGRACEDAMKSWFQSFVALSATQSFIVQVICVCIVLSLEYCTVKLVGLQAL